MNAEFISALEALEKEKNISKDFLIEAIETAINAAYKKSVGPAHDSKVEVDRDTGDIKIYALKTVVDEVIDDECEISLEDAQLTNPNYEIDDVWQTEVTNVDFGRTAAQTAKQVVVQKIREAEREIITQEFEEKKDEVITASVQRVENNNVYVELGKTDGYLPPSEQMRNERLYANDRIKVYVMEVRKTKRGPQIIVSRSHPGLVKRLFEMEVPELQSGVVEIVSVAREAGQRSKIAVYSQDENIDAIGSCVGQRGIRVERVVDELRGEKIDIIDWSEDPVEFIANALSPARVVMVYLYEASKKARVVVPDNHLSLAIGKEGQNARLAAKLTGWKIDIKSQTQIMELVDEDGNFKDDFIDEGDMVEFDEDILNADEEEISLDDDFDLDLLESDDEEDEAEEIPEEDAYLDEEDDDLDVDEDLLNLEMDQTEEETEEDED